MNLKKIAVVTMLVLKLMTMSIYVFAEQDNPNSKDNQNTENTDAQNYYDRLTSECKNKGSETCCLASVNAIKAGNYAIVPEQGCPAGYQPNMLRCKDSYTWCEPIKNTSEETTGQNTNPAPEQFAATADNN